MARGYPPPRFARNKEADGGRGGSAICNACPLGLVPHCTALNLDQALAFSIRWMSKRDQRGQVICPRSHSSVWFSAKPMLFSLPWKKPSISPREDQGRLLSLLPGKGYGQDMGQSLAAFMKRRKERGAEGLPSSGCQSPDLIYRGAQGQRLD